MTKSYKPEVQVIHDGNKWIGNGLRFPTFQEAYANAQALAERWTLVMAFRAVESSDAPNYRWVNHKLESIK